MKFGKTFVIPDPDSRLSHEPLKLVSFQSEPLVQNAEVTTHHVVSKSYRGKTLACDKYGFQGGKRYAKAISLDKLGAFCCSFVVVLLSCCLKSACSGAAAGSILSFWFRWSVAYKNFFD